MLSYLLFLYLMYLYAYSVNRALDSEVQKRGQKWRSVSKQKPHDQNSTATGKKHRQYRSLANALFNVNKLNDNPLL